MSANKLTSPIADDEAGTRARAGVRAVTESDESVNENPMTSSTDSVPRRISAATAPYRT
jgi:hypothetical protein